MPENDLLKSLGMRVRELRISFGWTQEYLAEQLGVSDPMISNLENGKKRIQIDNLLALSRIFDVSTDYLLKGTETYEINKETASRVADKKKK